MTTAQPINMENLTNDPLAFPIYVLIPGLELPEEGNYYVISRNGLWFHKDTGIMRGMVKVDGIGHLEDLAPTIGMRMRNIPEAIILRALLFFRKVYEEYHAESELQLFFNKDDDKFRLFCPEQTVSYGSVRYKPDQWNDPNHNLQGFLLVGTIHSHCDFTAYHSNMDLNDERYADGIHITIGHVDRKEFSCSCSMQLNHQRVNVDPRIKISGLEAANARIGFLSQTTTYRLKLPIARHKLNGIIAQLNGEIEKEWMPKVRQEFFRPHYQGGYGGHNLPQHSTVGRRHSYLDPTVDLEPDRSDSYGDDEIAPRQRDRPLELAGPDIEATPPREVSFQQGEEPANPTRPAEESADTANEKEEDLT